MTERVLRLYDDLADWFPVLTPPAEYAEEAAVYAAVLRGEAAGPVRTVLELGSGGGHNASHLKAAFTLTLVDRSPRMLAVSRRLNPECRHVEGDMRTVRLGERFDAVFVHDAVSYLTTEADLAAAMATAATHLAPGGAALFVPDFVAETFQPTTGHGGHDEEGRSLRYLEWSHAPEGPGEPVVTTMVYVLREGREPVRVIHEVHRAGLFPRATWLRLLAGAGLRATRRAEVIATGEPPADLFVGRRS